MSKYKFTTFGNVAQFINGFAFKPEDWESEGTPIIRIQNLTDSSKPFNYTTKKVPDQYIVKQGDLLVSWSATLDVYEWTEKNEAYLNQHIFKVVPDASIVYQPYLRYAIKRAINSMSKYTHGSTMKHINRAEFLSTEIPLPPLPEQKRIAAILDKADAVRRKRQETIRLLDEFLRSVFLEMFGEPVRNEKGWKKKKLEQICVKITDGTHSSPPNFSSGDYPYITAKNIKKQGIDLSELTYISKEYHKEIFQRCNPEKGDILYIKDGVTTGIAQVNTLDFEFSMLSSVALLKLNALEITPYYLREVLNNDSLYGYIRGQMGGAAITRLTLNKINNIPIPIPPIETQRKFDLIVQETEKQKELMRKSLTEMENSFNSLMQKAFRGEL